MADEQTTPTTPTTATATPPTTTTPTTTVAPDPSEEKITLTTAQLNERLARKEAAVAAKFQQERDAEKAKAAQEALKQRQEWQTLAEQHEARVKELEPQVTATSERYAALADRINKQIDAAIKDWPLEARKMLPPGDDVAARQDAYDNLRALLDKGALAAPQRGTPTRQPRPNDPNAGPSIEDQLRAEPRYQAI